MNKVNGNNQDSYKELMLMSELEDGAPISQREIAGRLGIALGLVNSYLKNLMQKGFVTVKAYPRNRYAYLLTPKGFTEKSRLALLHLANFTKLYREARKDFVQLFNRLSDAGHKRVAFCGVDEVAEIAYLSIQEAGLELVQIADNDCVGELFFGMTIETISCLFDDLPIVITAFYRADQLAVELDRNGINKELIFKMLGKS